MAIRAYVYIIATILTMPLSSFSQYYDSLLDVDVKKIAEIGVGRICIFGSTCEHCQFSHENLFYFIYDSSSHIKIRECIYKIENYEAIKISQSVLPCNECGTIIKYAKDNDKVLHNRLPKSDMIFPEIENGKMIFRGEMSQGEFYYFGIYSDSKLDYTLLHKFKKTNYLYDEDFNSWLFISLMRNQFLDAMSDKK